jgi:hypothetical protein
VKPALAVAVALLTAWPLAPQDRDYLTPNEIDAVREAQEPNERLELYIHFAKQRLDLVKQYLAKEKPGRSLFIHNSIADYTKIIEALDNVSDDALRRHVNIDKGTIAVLNAEKSFLDALNKIQEDQPPDFERYQFVLQEALDTTSDSRELCLVDNQKRSAELAAGDSKEKKEREANTAQDARAGKKGAAVSAESQQPQPAKKIPSLYKPGEKKPEDQP